MSLGIKWQVFLYKDISVKYEYTSNIYVKSYIFHSKVVLYLIRTAMKNPSDLVNIVLLVIVFDQTLGFEYDMRGDILKVYRNSKEGLISSGKKKDLM